MSVDTIPGTAPSQLEWLYEQYARFDVRQTTVTVDDSAFAAAAERGTVVEIRVHVEGSDGVLVTREGGCWARPGGVVDDGRSLSTAAADLVREQTGVDCLVEELRRVTIVCHRHERTDQRVWTLSALFGARPEPDATPTDAVWRPPNDCRGS